MSVENSKLNIKYLVIEDEPLARRGLVKLLSAYDCLECLGMYSNSEDARLIMDQQPVDLIFLDIHLSEESGLDFAKMVPATTQIIFTTAYAHYALESYELNALDYLLKPISEDRLKKSLDKVESFFLNRWVEREEKVTMDHIFVKADRKLFRLELIDIQYIEAMKDYVMIHTAEKKLMVAMNIKTIFNQLPTQSFVRVNKSFVVNVNNIESVDNHWVTVASVEIPLGASFKDDLLKRIEKHTLNR